MGHHKQSYAPKETANNAGIAMYRMHQNIYMGNCIALVFVANDQQINDNGLTNNSVCLYIKTPTDNKQINSLGALARGKLFDENKPIWLRVASDCEFGVFGDAHCDCESQRVASLRAIGEHGQGVFVQLPQEGLGRDLLYKARELELQVNGTTPDGDYVGPKDFFEAAAILSVYNAIDQRKFDIVGVIFKQLGLDRCKYTLLSANPQKAEELSVATGIQIVGNLSVSAEITEESMSVPLAKVCEGIMVPNAELRQVHHLLLTARSIPERTRSLIRKIAEDLAEGAQPAGDPALLKAIASTLDKF